MTSAGFIGIGHMGWPMAANLVKSGRCAVTVYDQDGERAARFAAEHGCAAARTLADLGSCDAIITMLPTGHDVREVLIGKGAGGGS
ncbi:MAG: NAD(P)-binding domain-containing protein, partial [Gaiellaceae bacterium]